MNCNPVPNPANVFGKYSSVKLYSDRFGLIDKIKFKL